jgi:RNA polymerase sigma-70 factor (ECF subfamily)
MVAQLDARSVPTEDLIARYQRGQTAAFSVLFRRYKDYVYRIALLVLRNSGDADEAVQETFLDVMRALPRYRLEGEAHFETWLYRVTVNRCRMRLRGSRPPSADWDELAEKLQTADPGHDPQVALQQSELRQTLWSSVDALADHHRLVVLLRYLYDLPYREIAEVLEISEGTVKSRLYTAHRRLRQQLAARGATQEPVQAEEWQTP